MSNAVIMKSELMNKYSLISSARGSTQDKPILRTIKVEGFKETTQIRLTANNRLVYGHVTLDALQVSGDFCFCADELVFQILGTFPDTAEVELEVNEDKLVMKHGRKIHEVMTIPVDDFEAVPQVGEYEVINLEKVVSAFETNQIATATDANRPALQCYNISTKSGAIISADGVQLMKYSGLVLPGEDTLPRQGVLKDFFPLLNYIAQAADASAVFGVNSGFKSEELGAELIVGRINAELFDLNQLFVISGEKEVLAKLVIPTASLSSALAVCKIYEARGLANGNPNTAVLHIQDNQVFITTTVKGLSDMTEPLEGVEMKILEEEQTLTFSAKLLSEFIDIVTAESIELKVLEGGFRSPFVVTVPEVPDCIYLQMPTQER